MMGVRSLYIPYAAVLLLLVENIGARLSNCSLNKQDYGRIQYQRNTIEEIEITEKKKNHYNTWIKRQQRINRM